MFSVKTTSLVIILVKCCITSANATFINFKEITPGELLILPDMNADIMKYANDVETIQLNSLDLDQTKIGLTENQNRNFRTFNMEHNLYLYWSILPLHVPWFPSSPKKMAVTTKK